MIHCAPCGNWQNISVDCKSAETLSADLLIAPDCVCDYRFLVINLYDAILSHSSINTLMSNVCELMRVAALSIPHVMYVILLHHPFNYRIRVPFSPLSMPPSSSFEKTLNTLSRIMKTPPDGWANEIDKEFPPDDVTRF